MLCPLCGFDRSRIAYDTHTKRGQAAVYLVCCQRCGLMALMPQPTGEQLRAIYSEEYFRRYYNPEAEQEFRLDYYGERLAEIESIRPVGKLLDVGCGMGYLLEVAAGRGWDVVGLELSPFACNYLTERGFTVVQGDLSSKEWSSDIFDVVTLWDVFEHLPDPRATLAIVRHILKPGGLLVIKVPNVGCILYRVEYLLGSILRQNRYHASTHLYHYTVHTLKAMASTTLNVKSVRTVKEVQPLHGDSRNLVTRLFWQVLERWKDCTGNRESILLYATK